MIEEIFKYKSVDFSKLLEYGFRKDDIGYKYITNILNEFELQVLVSNAGEVTTHVLDKTSGEPYILHLVKDAVGSFVGMVRAEYRKVLEDICVKCFYTEVFKAEQSKQIIRYIKDKYKDSLEFLWEKFSNNAIWRRKDNKKWYALLVNLSKSKLGEDTETKVDIIDLRIPKGTAESLIKIPGFYKAYHMNKESWITIILDGTVPIEKIKELVDQSYKMAK